MVIITEGTKDGIFLSREELSADVIIIHQPDGTFRVTGPNIETPYVHTSLDEVWSRLQYDRKKAASV